MNLRQAIASSFKFFRIHQRSKSSDISSGRSDSSQNDLRGVNSYWQKVEFDPDANKHREAIGGMWDEIGELQFQFMREQGLEPHHRFVDIGCGCLRGGIHFVRYLQAGHYYGIDINASLIEAGRKELERLELTHKMPNLIVDSRFQFRKFDQQFDFGIATSVFTHLFANHIVRCFDELASVIPPHGVVFASFFPAPTPYHLASITHQPGGITTHLDSDPFHYSFTELVNLADSKGLRLQLIGDWNHPRGQEMVSIQSQQELEPDN